MVDAWADDGKTIAINSSRRDPASRDSFLIDLASGSITLVARNPGVGNIANVSHDGSRALLSRLRSRGNNDLYLLDLTHDRETLITPHAGVANYDGELSPDGRTVYLATNQDRDLFAFARIRVRPDGTPGPIEVLAERPDAELDGLHVDTQGHTVVLAWNVRRRNELAFYDVATGTITPGTVLPAGLSGGFAFSHDR